VSGVEKLPELVALLDELVPFDDGLCPDWDDVLARAQSETARSRSRKRVRWSWFRTGLPILASVAITVAVVVFAIGIRARHAQGVGGSGRYPYTLLDVGTFGGPSGFLDLPGVPITSQGSVLSAADTAAHDRDYPHCPPPGACSDRYIQHAAVWQDGQLMDLGALPGQNSSGIYQQNSSGVGVGASEDGLRDPFTKTVASVAVMFENGKVINLGALPGGYESGAKNIDDQGQVAGFSSNGIRDFFACYLFGANSPCGWPTQVRAVVWRHGVVRDLGTLGGSDAIVTAQNDRGEIAGQSYSSDTNLTIAPFLWKNGHMINLGTLGGTSGSANWLNDSGEVVGQSNLSYNSGYNAFLWNGRRMIDLTPRAARASANWINDRGDVTGYTCATGNGPGCTGFLWRHGKLTVLPIILRGKAWASGNSVNNLDQVVGADYGCCSTDDKPVLAALWANGHAYDLNKLVAPSALRLINANYIDDHGDIVGFGTLPNGDQRMFLLTRNTTVPLQNK
jgi:probable HAF family extracellular repeat protein